MNDIDYDKFTATMFKHFFNILIFITVSTASCVLVPLVAQAGESKLDGHQLLEKCQVAVNYLDNGESTNDMESVRYCDDYLTGFREAENVKRIYMPGFYSPGYCLPRSGVSNGDAARVVVSYLKTHEQELNQRATDLLRDALIDGYPCTN
ncbi:MAG TPA: Rap1a/Tai family immunity protein [Gammaproteobacteria bacterium]|nr:Rap1a/Tai family immunity protein [Gammaproteobacteria bacterium]